MFTLTKGFLSLMLCQGGGEAGRKQRQDTWPKLATEVFHTTARHAQCTKWGKLPGRVRSLLGSAGYLSVGGELLCSLPLLFPLSLLLLVVAAVVLCYTLVTGLFLSQPVGVTFFWFLIPIPTGAGGEEGLGEEGSERASARFWVTGWA